MLQIDPLNSSCFQNLQLKIKAMSALKEQFLGESSCSESHPWKWDCELTQYLSNTCQTHCIYAIPGCKCSFKKTLSIKEWMAAVTSVK